MSSGKGNIKNMSLSVHVKFFFFSFFTTFKTNDKKRDWISLFIRNKNDHQMESGRVCWGGGGGYWTSEVVYCFILIKRQTESVSVQENS